MISSILYPFEMEFCLAAAELLLTLAKLSKSPEIFVNKMGSCSYSLVSYCLSVQINLDKLCAFSLVKSSK